MYPFSYLMSAGIGSPTTLHPQVIDNRWMDGWKVFQEKIPCDNSPVSGYFWAPESLNHHTAHCVTATRRLHNQCRLVRRYPCFMLPLIMCVMSKTSESRCRTFGHLSRKNMFKPSVAWMCWYQSVSFFSMWRMITWWLKPSYTEELLQFFISQSTVNSLRCSVK